MAQFDDWKVSADEVMSRYTAIDYELAGRLPSQTFRDTRSASKARRRQRKDLEKYWSYRCVNAGQVESEHRENVWSQSAEPAEVPTFYLRKEDLYRDAQSYPRPRALHRRPKYYARWPKEPRVDKGRRERKHAAEELSFERNLSSDPWYVAYVVGYADTARDIDDHIFQRCDVCWPELSSWYVDDEIFDANGDAVGPLDHQWEVEIGDVGPRNNFGYAGRSKVGAVFLMGDEDWRRFQSDPWIDYGGWGDSEYEWEDEWSQEETFAENLHRPEDDAVSEASSWVGLDPRKDEWRNLEDDWDVLSSCSSWSHVSR